MTEIPPKSGGIIFLTAIFWRKPTIEMASLTMIRLNRVRLFLHSVRTKFFALIKLKVSSLNIRKRVENICHVLKREARQLHHDRQLGII